MGFFGFSHTNTCSSRLFIHAHPVDFRPLTAKHPISTDSEIVCEMGVIVCEMGISCARWGNRVRDGHGDKLEFEIPEIIGIRQ